MSLQKVQEIRSRAQARVGQARTRIQARGFSGQQMRPGRLVEQARTRIQTRGFSGQQMRLGGGAFVEQARRRANVAARRMTERKPGIIPMVKEFRPGERLRQFFPQVTDRGDMSVMDDGAYPADGRGISIMQE